MAIASPRRAWLVAALCGALAACGSDDAAKPAVESGRMVTGVVMKGAVQSATVNFYNVDAAGNATSLVATVTTGSDGGFSAALPSSSAHLLVQTENGFFADESDPAPPASRRLITLPAGPSIGFESVLPPGAATLAITPYSHAMLLKARAQAAGTNFGNVFDAVRAQATTAFGFDPITTVPADPLSPADAASVASLQYAILLGAAAQSINALATSAARLPDFTDVMAFVSDFGDGRLDSMALAEQVRRFRNNNYGLYRNVALPVIDETLLSQPAVVPTGAVLPLLTGAGDLQLLDPSAPIDASNPVTIDTGLSPANFESRTLQRADITASVATNIRESRLVYIRDNGSTRTVWKVNLEPGQDRTPVQVSNITDACRINGMGEDFGNPDNTILRIDTAGTNGICEDGSGDDFTTAEAYLVPLSATSAQGGTQVGLGHCCGIVGIGNTSGGLVGVLTTEDDGTGSTFFLRRRNVGSLGSPIAVATLDIAGTGQIHAQHQRGLGDQHIYIRAKRSGDASYKLLRFNVTGSTLTPVFDYGTADAGSLLGDFENATHDATNLYFTSGDGTAILKVPHSATGEGSATAVVSGSPGEPILQVLPTTTRLVYEVSGVNGGVFSAPKAGGPSTALGQNSDVPTFHRLAGANGARVFIDRVSGIAAPVQVAYAVDDDGANPGPDIGDAHWAGRTFNTTCNFNLSCEDTIGAQSLYLRRLASTTDAQIELADPATGAATGTYLGTIFGVDQGIKVFGGGFGRYVQFTVIADANSQTDLFIGDSALASASPPAEALAAVANAAGGGNNFWLLFDASGNSGGADADGDGLSDAQESALGTDPFDVDSDNDGLSDFDEVTFDGDPDTYQAGVDTDPNNPDTDGDGVGDGAEVAVGSDPLAANTVRFVDPTVTCGGACDGLSWATAYPNDSFVEGSNVISGTGTGSEAYVLFAPGGYGSLDLAGFDREHVIYIGSLGPGAYVPAFPPTTIFNPGAGARALHLTQVAAVGIANMRFENGLDSTLGGGVLLEAPVHSTLGVNTVQMDRVEIANNVSGGSGGGVAASGSGNFLNIVNSTIFNNQAQGSAGSTALGGGVLALGSAQVTVIDGFIYGNNVTCASAGCLALGGGGAASGGALLDLQTTIIESNHAVTGSGSLAAGGGVGADTAASLLLTASEVRLNDATGNSVALGAGGGIAVIDAALTASFGVIRGNVSTAQTISPPSGGGGGVYADTNATVTLQENIIADNKAAAGPGGGVNLVDSGSVLLQDNKFLSNGSLNPGGGLHVHPAGVTSVFNNLFVGNAATDAAAEGGAMELDVTVGNPVVAFESNTVAYNQTTASSGLGGGISVKASVPASMDLNNNNIWFNQDSTAAANSGDNYQAAGTMTVSASGNNVNEASLTGGNLSPPLNPLFVQGFFLDPAASPSVDAGDDSFAGPLTAGGYTTSPGGTSDSPVVDIGFHHQGQSAGSFGSVALTPSRSLSCSSLDTFIFTPSFAGATQGEPGHLIVVELSGVVGPTLGSLTTLDPRASGSRVARDLGDGRYAVTTSGFQSGSATGTFTIYADDQATPRTFTVTFTNAC